MEDAGAVALIGNTAVTYLNFSVAMVTGNQNPFAGLDPENMGLFDALMHPDYNSLGMILNEEKIAAERVTGMGEELISWHIYAMHLLGDPSLNPYIGIPQEINATYEFYPGANPMITVQAVPQAYFAVTDENNQILGTGITGIDGSGFAYLDPIATDNIHLCITAKNEIPYLEEIAMTGMQNNEIPAQSVRLENYPNPFNPTTEIRFQILNFAENDDVEIVIFNLKGQQVKSFHMNSSAVEPINSITWNGTDRNKQSVSSGIYYYALRLNGEILAAQKMVLLK